MKRSTLTLLSWICLMTIMLPAVSADAETKTDYNLEIVLAEAVVSGTREFTDLTLEFRVRDGKLQKDFRGRTYNYGQGRHEGTIVKSEMDGLSGAMQIDVRIKPDYWRKGGLGSYTIQLKSGEEGDVVVGSYTGKFTATAEPKPVAPNRPGKKRSGPMPPWMKNQAPKGQSAAKEPDPEIKKMETTSVKGNVRGQTIARWPWPVEGFTPPKPTEHPRLIVRKSELEQIKKRVKTDPAAKAMMDRFWKVLDKEGLVINTKFSTWPAIGYGFAYQMTGDTKHADKAREIIRRHLRTTGGQDIHHGPRLMGMALTFDLCADGWNEEFRAVVVEEIQYRIRELATGTAGGKTMGGFNPNWWSNHNGIRAAAAGLGALAIMGEKNTSGEVMTDAKDIADQMAWEIRGYIRDGLGGGAWGMEGAFYRAMTLRRGVLHFIHAYPRVTGKQIDGGDFGDWLLAGYFMEAEPGKLFPRTAEAHMGVDSEPLAGIVWTTGLGTVNEQMMPGVKYLLERSIGLKGDKTYGINFAMYAPYMLAGYPYDVEEKAPAESFPWISPDVRNGHWVFRPVWKDADDILMTLNLQSRVLRGCHHERTGTMSGWELEGFGTRWIHGQYRPAVKGRETAISAKNGPKCVGWDKGDRWMSMTLDIAPAYMPPVPKKDERGVEDAIAKGLGGLRAWRPDHPWGGYSIDYGIRGRRHIAVDATGKSGSPLLVALVEDIGVVEKLDGPKKAAPVKWWLPLDSKGKKISVDGNRFTSTDGDATMTGIVLGASSLDKGDLSANLPDGKVLVVFTLQEGSAAAMEAEGTGLNAKVTVGKRKVRFDGTSIVLE